jgi:hypothetical protein
MSFLLTACSSQDNAGSIPVTQWWFDEYCAAGDACILDSWIHAAVKRPSTQSGHEIGGKVW